MKKLETILKINNAVQKGAKFISFDYKKKDGTQSHRNILVNVDISKAQEKRGEPLKQVGNWQSGNSAGNNGLFVERDGETYLRGYDKGKQIKVFKIAGISNVKCGKK